MTSPITCRRCEYSWFQRSDRKPLHCPKCGTKSWDSPPRRECPYCNACPDHGDPSKVPPAPPAPPALPPIKEGLRTLTDADIHRILGYRDNKD